MAEATTLDESWSIKRTGFLHPQVSIRRKGAEVDLARMAIHWRRTRLEMLGGPGYVFERTGVAIPAWQFLGPDGSRWVHIEPIADRGTLAGGIVSVAPAALALKELPLLLLTGWYYIMHEWLEEETAAVAASVLVATG